MGKEPLGGGHITSFAQEKINGLTEAGSVIQAATAGSRAFQVCTRTVFWKAPCGAGP
jgi:hypothetical protein